MKGWEFTVLGPAPILVSCRHQDNRIHRHESKGHSAVRGAKQLMLLVVLQKRWAGGRWTGCKRSTVKSRAWCALLLKKRRLQHWMHVELSIWGSPSALLDTGKAPSEFIWGSVLQERHRPLEESPEDTGEHCRKSRNNPYKDLELRNEERGEIWDEIQFEFQRHPQDGARQASPRTGMGAVETEWRQEKGPRGPKSPPQSFPSKEDKKCSKTKDRTSVSPQICWSKGQTKPWPEPSCEKAVPEVWDKDVKQQHFPKTREEL